MFLDLVKSRRSIRKFKDIPVERDKIEILIEAALRSPSSRGIYPWEFIVVTKPETLTELSASKPHGAGFLKNAPLGIVVAADPEKCDVWVEDSSIATTYIQLAAESIGLKSCWIQIRKRMYDQDSSAEKRVAQILGLPDNLRVESIVAVGYPDENRAGHKKEDLLYGKVHYEKF